MSELKDKVRINDTTYYFMECPDCSKQRKFDKPGIAAIVMMGGASIAAILAIIPFVAPIGVAGVLLIGYAGKLLFRSKLLRDFGEKMEDKLFNEEKVAKLVISMPVIEKWSEEGVGIFKCPNCGNNEIIREE